MNKSTFAISNSRSAEQVNITLLGKLFFNYYCCFDLVPQPQTPTLLSREALWGQSSPFSLRRIRKHVGASSTSELWVSKSFNRTYLFS